MFKVNKNQWNNACVYASSWLMGTYLGGSGRRWRASNPVTEDQSSFIDTAALSLALCIHMERWREKETATFTLDQPAKSVLEINGRLARLPSVPIKMLQKSGNILFSMWDQTSSVRKVRIQLLSGQVHFPLYVEG